MHPLEMLNFVLTVRCGSRWNIFERSNDADVSLASLFWKWTLYLSLRFARPRYVDDGVLAMVSPCRLTVLVDVELNMAYSVFDGFICRSYSRAHLSTCIHSICRFRFESASNTRSSAYSSQFMRGRPRICSPVPNLLLHVNQLVACCIQGFGDGDDR